MKQERIMTPQEHRAMVARAYPLVCPEVVCIVCHTIVDTERYVNGALWSDDAGMVVYVHHVGCEDVLSREHGNEASLGTAASSVDGTRCLSCRVW